MNNTHEELVKRAGNYFTDAERYDPYAQRIISALLTRNAELEKTVEGLMQNTASQKQTFDALAKKYAELEAWNAQFRAGCDGKCAMYECVCPTDDDKKRIAELEAEKQWQPIETAPKDRDILVFGGEIEYALSPEPKPNTAWVKVRYHPCVTYDSDYNEVAGWSVCDTCYYAVTIHNPTHWMPLPAVPEQAKEAQG